MEYTFNELKVLWHLKRTGPITTQSEGPKDSVIRLIAETLGIRQTTLGQTLRRLDEKCLILRTYKRGGAKSFVDKHGFDPIIRLELVDPQMYLPPLPAPPPLAAVVAAENRDLYDRTEHEPSVESIILALLESNEHKQAQINKLQEIVDAQAKEIIEKNRQVRREQQPSHLNSRVRDALTPEAWDKLTHGR